MEWPEFKEISKPEKLTIAAFKDAGRRSPIGEFKVMFNPTSLSRTYAIQWGKNQGLNASGVQVDYARSAPSELSLDLVLDGTGVDPGVTGRQSVDRRVQEFLDLTYAYNGSIHEPNYLHVQWGSLKFDCRLLKVEVKYTLFDRQGVPLRAELKVELISDDEASRRKRVENRTSPDLTHARIVRAGDTLPLLTRSIYGTSTRYLDVARYNDLDDFRNIVPGRQLLFPPTAELDRAVDTSRRS